MHCVFGRFVLYVSYINSNIHIYIHNLICGVFLAEALLFWEHVVSHLFSGVVSKPWAVRISSGKSPTPPLVYICDFFSLSMSLSLSLCLCLCLSLSLSVSLTLSSERPIDNRFLPDLSLNSHLYEYRFLLFIWHCPSVSISFIPDISIAPLQIHYYSEALWTTPLILHRS